MNSRAVVALATLLLLPALEARAQIDDLLTPLPTTKVREKKKGDPRPLSVKGRAGAKSELSVRIAEGVRGARLSIDNHEMGLLPGKVQQVAPGEHVVTVTRAGYADFVRKVTVGPGHPNALTVKLEPVAGFLSISAEGGTARVLVDGKTVGFTPVADLVLAPGTHQVSVRQEGFQTEERVVAIRLGREQAVAVKLVPLVSVAARPEKIQLAPPLELHPPPTAPVSGTVERATPLHQRWYVWAGAGAVVAAVVVGAAASSASHAHAVRPFDPATEVCRGQCDQCIGPACSAAR